MSRLAEFMGCDEVEDHLEAYLDGDLDDVVATALEAHLSRCARCTAEHRLARDVLTELRSLPRPETPEDVLAEIRAAAGLGLPWIRSGGGGRSWGRGAAMLAAAVVLLGFVVGVWWRNLVPAAGPSKGEIARATAEAKYTLALVGAVTSSANGEQLLRDRVLRPAIRRVSRTVAGLRSLEEPVPGETEPPGDTIKRRPL